MPSFLEGTSRIVSVLIWSEFSSYIDPPGPVEHYISYIYISIYIHRYLSFIYLLFDSSPRVFCTEVVTLMY